MFKILGADGKEYGPASVEQLKEWVRQGRANHETKAQAAGATDWKPLAQYPEFADLFPAPAPAAAPVPAPTAAAPAEVVAPAAPAIATPAAPSATASPDPRAQARQQVAGPAIALMTMAALGMVFQIGMIILNLIGVTFPIQQGEMNPEAARMMHLFSGVIGVVFGIIYLAVGAFIIFSGLKMQKLSSHGIALTGAVVAMIPCFSPCCLLGLPIGIWALVVLNKPEVRSQFEH